MKVIRDDSQFANDLGSTPEDCGGVVVTNESNDCSRDQTETELPVQDKRENRISRNDKAAGGAHSVSSQAIGRIIIV